MQYFPPALETLVEHFAKLPGIGRKSAQRLAFHVLSLTEEEAAAFAAAITDAKLALSLVQALEQPEKYKDIIEVLSDKAAKLKKHQAEAKAHQRNKRFGKKK